MEKFVLCCESTVDLSRRYLDKRNIKYISFKFYMNDVEYVDDLGETISYKEFYNFIRKGVITKTSQIIESEYVSFFEPFLEEGKDVIHVCLSSGISGTYNSAILAKCELEEKYPDRKIIIIDSLGASSGYGMLVDTLADMRDRGEAIECLLKKAEEIKMNVNYLFFSSDLTCYIRGGRVSKTVGIIGGLLKICPILYVDKNGKLVQKSKVRTKKKAIIEIVNMMEELCDKEYKDKCFISHSDCLQEALQVKKIVEEKFINLKDKVLINDIGTTIGSHSGPGTVALFFYGKKR